SSKGKLYLIPSPLGEGGARVLPQYVVDRIHQLRYFIAERAKTARHFIKASQPPYAISELTVVELNKRTPPTEWRHYLQAAEAGQDIGLLSEAGCPGVADPGAQVVELAHQLGITVVPLVGPSSILLALMASGMNGQRFCFHGYLSPKKPDLRRELKKLEQESSRLQQCQIFIETPYRNQGLLEAARQVLQPRTRFGLAVDLTLSTEWIRSQRIAQWRQAPLPNLHKRPAIFLLEA
ncbi:MAG: SAM-dependent methyltransferase, partial [Bacteroidota bacterium]